MMCCFKNSFANILWRTTCGSDGKESVCNAGDPSFDPWVCNVPWRREWQRTPVFLPGEFHGQRSLGSQIVGHDWVTNGFQEELQLWQWVKESIIFCNVLIKFWKRVIVALWKSWAGFSLSDRISTRVDSNAAQAGGGG